MEQLSQVLWRERELLEELLFRLEVEQLVLASGRNRWLQHAAADVERLLDSLRRTEVLRATAAGQAAERAGLEASESLRSLAESCDEPWRQILLDHHRAFVGLTDEIAAMADTNRHLITRGYQAAREVLTEIGGPDSYTPDGEAAGPAPAPRLVDRSL